MDIALCGCSCCLIVLKIKLTEISTPRFFPELDVNWQRPDIELWLLEISEKFSRLLRSRRAILQGFVLWTSSSLKAKRGFKYILSIIDADIKMTERTKAYLAKLIFCVTVWGPILLFALLRMQELASSQIGSTKSMNSYALQVRMKRSESEEHAE